MPGRLGDLASLPGWDNAGQNQLPQLGQSMPDIQRVGHQGSGGAMTGFQVRREFSGSELQHDPVADVDLPRTRPRAVHAMPLDRTTLS
jgi:hypothetical protein